MLSSTGVPRPGTQASIVDQRIPVTARIALVAGALFAFLAVGLGAFGAHALKARLSTDALAVWQTAVLYHGWHALALVGVGAVLLQRPGAGGFTCAAWLFGAGILLFSGSLYALALTGLRTLGMVTPVGGVLFLAGWLAFAWGAWHA